MEEDAETLLKDRWRTVLRIFWFDGLLGDAVERMIHLQEQLLCFAFYLF
jgi:hypothetical protein